MANPGKAEEKDGEKLRWIGFIIGLMITVGGGANAIYRSRGDTLDLINMVMIYVFLLGFVVCLNFDDGREGKGKMMMAVRVFIILIWGNLGWAFARAFKVGVLGQIVCPLLFVFALLACILVPDKCCSSKEGAVVPVED